MFPIVPYNLNSKCSSVSQTGVNFLTSGKVYAATNISQGAVSAPIEPELLLGQPDSLQVSIGVDSFNKIDLQNTSKNSWRNKTHWIRTIRLAEDCHSFNIQLCYKPKKNNINKNSHPQKLILETIRPISPGQELLLWFSEDILASLQIAFLTPANIQGQKKYVCTKCSSQFESPNPLKLHITLSCGRQPVSDLWEKLHEIITKNFATTEEIFDFKLISPQLSQGSKQRTAMDLSVSRQNPTDLYKPYTATSSAFKPFKRTPSNFVQVETEGTIKSNDAWPTISFDQDFGLVHRLRNSSNYDDEAQIESLVSSLGRSKQGHICLYCGKCYSRKYGLKIHIRTHTGYKPLKCKFCMRPFGDPSNLNKHVRLHAEGNTPYKCDLCGKILVRRRDLDRHLKSRHMIEMHPGLNILENSNTEEETQVSSNN